jgi:CheY-like chemotaxis protein
MRTLLLADDSITVQRVIALTFAETPIQVIAVGDGQQALERMAAQPPDIVLAGTSLPQISGYDLAKFMRGNAQLRQVPVLLLSGAFETVDEARLAASGANGVIEKPVEPALVISRVKELLGMKGDDKPAGTNRLVTPADGPERKLTVAAPQRPVTSARPAHARVEEARAENPRPAGEAANGSNDYLDTLDAAFDSLDQQLSGRAPSSQPNRNPSGPIGQGSGSADPRSPGPGRTPSAASSATGNPVFEVDDDWFSTAESQARADGRAGRREIAEDLRDPGIQPSPAAPQTPAGGVFEVDDEWFAEDDKARAARKMEQAQLAKEMGIHEVELPNAEPITPPASDLDFEFGIDDFKAAATNVAPPAPANVAPPAAANVAPATVPTAVPPAPPPGPPKRAPFPASPVAAAPTPIAAAPKPVAPIARPVSAAPVRPVPASPPPPETKVADDFDALLAFERGERAHPPAPPPPEIKVVEPKITDEMLDQIANRVAERLNASTFGTVLRDAMAATMRDTVRDVVSETSERLIRDAVPAVIAETSERVIRDTVPGVVAEASERLVRDAVLGVVTETSERLVRDTVNLVVSDAVHMVVAEASERVVRETVPTVVAETSERLVREATPGIVSETSERLVRDSISAVVTETSERLVRDSMPGVLVETSERLMRDAVPAVIVETSERMVRNTVPGVVAEASERLVRDLAPGFVGEAAERQIRDNVRSVVSETSERIVRDEIERIKSKKSV